MPDNEQDLGQGGPEVVLPTLTPPPERGSGRWRRPLLIAASFASTLLVIVLFGEAAVDTAIRLNTGEDISDIRSTAIIMGTLVATGVGVCGYFMSRERITS